MNLKQSIPSKNLLIVGIIFWIILPFIISKAFLIMPIVYFLYVMPGDYKSALTIVISLFGFIIFWIGVAQWLFDWVNKKK